MSDYTDAYNIGDVFEDLDSGSRFDDVLAEEFELDQPEPDEMVLLIEAIKDLVLFYGRVNRKHGGPDWVGCHPLAIFDVMIKSVRQKIVAARDGEVPEGMTSFDVICNYQSLYRALIRIKFVVKKVVEEQS